MRPSLTLAAVLLLALAGCGGGGGTASRDCSGGPITVSNASSIVVEQFYLGAPPNAWGPDQLRGRDLAQGGSLTLARPVAGDVAARAVWANGRAVELGGLNACAVRRITIMENGLRAE
jgi:hypothetical protein